MLGRTLELNGGAIRSTATQTDADLRYAGLGHDPEHKVDWRWPREREDIRATGVAISSAPGDDDRYALGDTIRVSLTFSDAVDVDTTGGTPRLKIKMGPTYGEKWADYSGGSGTTTLTFDYTVVQPNTSPGGVAVLANTLELNGGAIRSTGTRTDAHLTHAGLAHSPSHKVDWHQREPGAPWVTGVAISSDPGDDNTYALGDTIQFTATFNEVVNVDTTGGTPRLKIKMTPTSEEKWADYSGGSGTTTLTFDYTVVKGDISTDGVAVLANVLEMNGGTIRSAATPATDVHLRYWGRWHDLNHLVDGEAPPFLGVAVGGRTVSLSYDEALDIDSIPPASAFTVLRTPQDGTEEAVALTGPPVIAAGAVMLTLSDAVLETDTSVKVSYDKSAAAAGIRLRDKAGNEAASITNKAVDPTDTTQPQLVRGEIDGEVLTLFFSEPLDEKHGRAGRPLSD